MVAGRGESTRGRGPGGRAETPRQFRRVQGLDPPELESLKDVERAARKANTAKRKAALEANQSSDAEVRTDFQEDAHQVSTNEALEEVPEIAEGEFGLDELGQASEGGADLKVSRVEGRVSDSSPPGQDVSSKLQSEVQVELPPPVPEEKPVEYKAEPTLEEKLQPELVPSTEIVRVELRDESTSGQLAFETGVPAQ
ncbi:hypothetical protein PHMEG_00012724 [Phytophthora megakarya]|uniref:Uncharacterized protein n=1 Tax=Phytophthora megakarya TaxID=4795 RepID=A0A225W9J2_9STRA|nr:hypothetical protein PHMEG_00012724 [Phytophthora megakarya]